MIGEAERRALYNLTKHYWQKDQDIIDAGAFLGASTKAFLSALTEIGVTKKSIQTYEYGIFNDYNAKVASNYLDKKFENGADFGEILKSLVDDKNEIVAFHFGDIKNHKHAGREICIAFLDILKSPDLMTDVYCKFFPSFRNGTILYQQDYFHPFHPWIAYSMAKYSDAIRYVGRPDADSAAFNAGVFQVTSISKLPLSRLEKDDTSTKEEVLDWMNKAVSMHDHPYEKMNVVGLKSAAQAIFEKDENAALASFEKGLKDVGLINLVEESAQQHHINRIRRFIGIHAKSNATW